jgi:uncharacterized membrane protein
MKKYFFTGLGILVPLVATIAILVFLIDFLTKPFVATGTKWIAHWNLFPQGYIFLSQQEVAEYISRIFVLLFLIAITICIGLLTRWFFLNRFIKIFDNILLRIPLFSSLYKTCKEIIKTILNPEKSCFKKVVLVPFPRPGVFTIGIVAQDSPESCSKASKKKLISVIVPNAPNPTTGLLLMLSEEELIPIKMSPEEALQYIISCGTIMPNPADI